MGDMNRDGSVDASDVTKLLRHVARIETISDADQLAGGDVSFDGSVDASDVTKLLRYVAKIISSLD